MCEIQAQPEVALIDVKKPGQVAGPGQVQGTRLTVNYLRMIHCDKCPRNLNT